VIGARLGKGACGVRWVPVRHGHGTAQRAVLPTHIMKQRRAHRRAVCVVAVTLREQAGRSAPGDIAGDGYRKYITDGERIAQLVFCKVEKVNLIQVQTLSTSDRGEGGFGSTGVK